MPNWCHNRVTLSGDAEDLSQLKPLIGSEDHPFDFNKIMPMPESLNIEAGSKELGYQAVYGDWRGLLNYSWIPDYIETQQELINYFWRKHPDLLEMAEIYKENRDKYGHLNWYSWRLANWGTKWPIGPDDLLVVIDSEDCMQLEFDTAWSPADGIHEKVQEIINEQGLSCSITWFYDEPGMCSAGYL
jgi:hypothetical protein